MIMPAPATIGIVGVGLAFFGCRIPRRRNGRVSYQEGIGTMRLANSGARSFGIGQATPRILLTGKL